MSILTKEVIQKILNDDWLLMDDCEGLENCTVIKELARMALAAMDSEPVAVPDHLTYLQNPTLENVLSDAEENSPMSHAARILAREVKFWRSAPLYRHAQPAPVVPDENVSFHRLTGESEYDRLNRQREWMESKSKLAKVTAVAPDDLTERLLRLRAQATLDGSYLGTEEWDSLACDAIKALNACRAAMLQAGNPAAWWQGLYGEIKGRGQRSEGDFTPDLGMSTEDIIDAINKRHVSDAGNSPGINGAEQRIADAVELLKQAAPAMLADNNGPNGPLVGRLKSPVIPDGYVMVPKESTEEMLQASYREAAVYSPTAYRAMIAAAPQEGKQ